MLTKNEILEPLNKQQKAAVVYHKGPLAIVAGAGSGKTKTITRKIAYMLTGNIKPKEILAVTFTNKAAKEMRTRLTKLVGPEGSDVFVSTYHSLSAKILREEISYFEGYKKWFNILDDVDQIQILRHIYRNYSISPQTFSFKETLMFIAKNKAAKTTGETLLKEAKNDTEKIMAKVFIDYEAQKTRMKSLDFDDLLIFTDRLFIERPDIAEKWSKKFKYVLVDEFQDTSWIQYEIIKKLAAHNNITIVGDPDQTIYTWRQADVEILNNFKSNFKKSTVIKLETNYRSTSNILNAANQLISHNPNRIKKNLVSVKGPGSDLDFYHAFSEDAEARWVVEKIRELKKEKNQLKDIAVLYRANYLSQAIEKAFMNEGINYVIFGGAKFYQRHEIKDALAFLKVIYDGDEVSFRRIINIPARKIGKVAVSSLLKWAKESNMQLYQAIITNFNDAPLSSGQKQSLATLVNLIRKYHAALKSNPIATVLEKFLIEVNYKSVWRKKEDLVRFDNITRLIDSIKEWEKKNPTKGIEQFIQEIILYTGSGEEVSKDYASLMTVHASKGLEFKNVFLIGFSDGIFPSNRSMTDDGNAGLEEERRLAYVAITRAMDRLFISHSRGFAIDHKTQKKPSMFIRELGINVQDFTSEFIAPASFEDNLKTNNDISVGDRLSHIKFGIGKVVKMDNELIDIAFKDPYGIKTLMKNHKSIERVK